MSNDRRQIDRRVGEKDRRKGDRRSKEDKKTLTLTLTAFVTIVIVVIILFVTTLAFMAVYFEKKLNDAENEDSVVLTPLDYPSEYIDISNFIYTDDPVNPEENSPEESNPESNPEESNPEESNLEE